MGKSLVSSSSRSLPGSELECCPGDPLPSSPLLSSLPPDDRGWGRGGGRVESYLECTQTVGNVYTGRVLPEGPAFGAIVETQEPTHSTSRLMDQTWPWALLVSALSTQTN